jgi:hypothetical protein
VKGVERVKIIMKHGRASIAWNNNTTVGTFSDLLDYEDIHELPQLEFELGIRRGKTGIGRVVSSKMVHEQAGLRGSIKCRELVIFSGPSIWSMIWNAGLMSRSRYN